MIEYWEARDGRWYWHLKRRGRVTADGSYSSSSNVRRAMRKMYPGVPLRRLG